MALLFTLGMIIVCILIRMVVVSLAAVCAIILTILSE